MLRALTAETTHPWTHAALPVLERFGPYVIHAELGVGGMATVDHASVEVARSVRRSVALKRLLGAYTDDRCYVDNFVREAQLASTLHHPSIVQIFDFGCIDRTYYIAMELVQGSSLLALLRESGRRRRRPPIPIALALLDELCDALDYSSNGTDTYGEPLRIVHRDLSPGNLMVTFDGHLKLIDFGIAKAIAGSRFVTSSGLVKGKIGYIAVELLDGKPLDTRSDLFSAGVIAWELVTGRKLFDARSDAELVEKMQRAPIPPPSALNPDCPAELDAIVLRALARPVEARWQSAAGMRAALSELRRDCRHATPREVAAWVAGLDTERATTERDVFRRDDAVQGAAVALAPTLAARQAGRMKVLAVAVWIALAGGADAQPAAPTASTVLANVQQYYANTSQLTAGFRQVVTNATFGTSRASEGKLWVAKPSSLRFDYLQKTQRGDSVSKSFVFNGTTLWLVDHVNKQIYKQAAQGGALPAAVSFLTNANALGAQFNVSLSASGSRHATVLELAPKQPSAQYKQIFLVVDANGSVTESIVVDANGDTSDFTFLQPNTRAPVPKSTFVVNPAALPTYKLIP